MRPTAAKFSTGTILLFMETPRNPAQSPRQVLLAALRAGDVGPTSTRARWSRWDHGSSLPAGTLCPRAGRAPEARRALRRRLPRRPVAEPVGRAAPRPAQEAG